MSSRSAVGPQQHRVASGARAPNRSRPTAQINTSLSNARRPPALTVDLTGDCSKQSFGLSPTVQPDGAKPLPSTPPLVSPNPRDGPPRRPRPSNLGTEPATVRPSAVERQSTGVTVPFPPRPGQNAPEDYTQANEVFSNKVDPVREDGKRHSLDPPAVARHFPQGSACRPGSLVLKVPTLTCLECADYHPWQGNHPEDQLSEQTVKSGFQNKPLISNETNTARPSLWNHLKNKQGLSTLSQLFVTVLDKRQTAGRLTAPSTFKPPPRIVFTAPRREQWLQELANSSVVLRRFSKTIPHGIVGKGLLDACLTNNIPVARAVWLAKCVGSNELRSLKRKGANTSAPIGNEHKWVREWTINVEQWVDGVLSLCGQELWSAKIHYAIRLSAALFNEQLLDLDHFLSWILSSLEDAPIERLPFWLLLVQTYWKHLVSARRRGRRLAGSIFKCLKSASAGDEPDLLRPVIERLQALATMLAVAHKGCMILPELWPTYKQLLQPRSDAQVSATLQGAIDDLSRRNDRLGRTAFSAETESNTSRKRLFNVLDGADLKASFEQTIQACTDAVSDSHMLAFLVVQWSSSIYRYGIHCVYIATRLLRRCYAQGVDVDSVLLTFVSEPPSSQGTDFSLVFKIVTELVRSGHFSVARFFQSLIATGALNALHDKGPVLSALTSRPLLLPHLQPYERLALLAAALPTHELPEHVATLRDLLLRETDDTAMTDSKIINDTIEHINLQLLRPNDTISPTNIADNLSLSARSVVSHWIRGYIQARYISEEDQGEPNVDDITCSRFLVARNLLEQMEDFTMLADVIGLTISNADAITLAASADALHLHLQCFAAIGALRPLYKALLERYQLLRGQEQLDKQSIMIVKDLSTTLGVDHPILQQLSFDMARCTQRDAVTMCSPASDNAADVLQIGVDTDDEIDRILSSGTTMEEQIMSRVFKRIITRAEKDDAAQRTRVGHWLSRLQSFDRVALNKLMMEWMTALLSSAREQALELLPTLLGCHCLSMSAFAQCAENVRQHNDRTFGTLLDLDVLDAVFPAASSSHSGPNQDGVRDRLERDTYTFLETTGILSRLQRVILTIASTNNLEERLFSLISRPTFIGFLKRAAVENRELLASSLGLSSSETAGATGAAVRIARRIVDFLVDPLCHRGGMRPHYASNTLPDGTGSAEVRPGDRFPKLLEIADELSLPFCQLQMRTLLSSSIIGSVSGADVATDLFKAITEVSDDNGCVWPELIRNLDYRLAQRMRELAELKLFTAIPLAKQTIQPAMSCTAVKKLLRIVECSPLESNLQAFQQTAPIITEKLRLLLDLLNAASAEEVEAATNSDTKHICLWINALLYLATLRKPSVTEHSKPSPETGPFLTTLAVLLNHPRLQSSFPTLEYIFDVAAYFADNLTDDQRGHIRNDLHKSPDPRLNFLFGASQSADAWLGLATSINPPPGNQPASASQPTQPSARPPHLSRQSSTPQPIRPGTPSSSQQQQQRTNSSSAQQAKTFNPPVPYPLRRWEIIDLGGSSHSANAAQQQQQQQSITQAANDTAISLTLFGARRIR